MPDRPKLGPGSGVIPGLTFFTEYQSVMKGLWDSSCLPLTGVAGTADDVEAVLDWPLDAGLIDGMKFTLTWAATNTGPMTLRLNWSGGNTPQVDVLTLAGDAMNPGTVEAGARAMVEYISGSFRVLGGGGEGGAMAYYEALTSSGTWTKPPGFADDAMVIVQAWGAGGGGAGGARTDGPIVAGANGGNGGGYGEIILRYSSAPATVPYVIGAGGVGGNGAMTAGPGQPGTAGGYTEFGAFLRVDGGAGTDTPGNAAVNLGSGTLLISPGWLGGVGGVSGGVHGESSIFGGGGGGGGANTSGAGQRDPGLSLSGGSGGASINVAGSPAEDGEIPGGGGGGGRGRSGGGGSNGGFGARGEIRIWIVG